MSVQSLKARLQKLSDDFELEVAKRELHFEGRSEQWQESDKGEVYQEITEAIREAGDLLQESLDYVPSENYPN